MEILRECIYHAKLFRARLQHTAHAAFVVSREAKAYDTHDPSPFTKAVGQF